MLTRIKENLAERIVNLIDLDKGQILSLFERPKSFDHGHLAMPVFALAKSLKKAPPVIAQEVAEKISGENFDFIEKVEPVSGFVNIHLSKEYAQTELMKSVMEDPENLGHTKHGDGKKMVIDFSSPNVAKPMSIGHLRATVIGQSIYNLARTQGYEVIGLNHLGDWGVQFGKLAWAYQNWGEDYDFINQPFESLFELYVNFHKKAESDPELDAQGSLTFKKLEEGDPEIQKLWEKFVKISMQEYQKLWDRLGVKHDLVKGESFYNDQLKSTEQLIEGKGLLEESEGAMVVRLDDLKLPPCLIRKSDGASLYATRDIASAIYRHDELGADLNLYVVGVDQNMHFKQVFEVISRMGYEWSKDCHHISFGMYRFKEGRMSTRKGNVIFLQDVLDRAVDLVAEVIEKKNPDLENKAQVAEQVGVGAIIFNDLLTDRVKNVDFDWDRVLDFEGDSGPYVQYCQVRCWSLMEKYGKEIPSTILKNLETVEEQVLIKTLLTYSESLELAFRKFKPHVVATYLLELCRAFNHFYHKCRILGEEEELEASRMALVKATQVVLKNGLAVLNIQSPQRM